MRVADIFFAFPLIIGAVVIILVVGRGVTPVILAIGLFSWATVARLLRSSILSIRESEYVEAARSLGASKWRIVTRHVLPNSMAPVLVYAMVSVATAIVAQASLSFLGVGVPPDVPDWGNMISSGQKFFGFKDYLWFFPSMAVVFTVLGFVFVGDGMRDALDPRLR
jgi:peptide/nickel transport system permease protein